jgi:hypothetical protein
MAPAADDLQRRARDFARRVQRSLNATICDGVKITAVVIQPQLVRVGHGLAPRVFETTPFPVRLGRGRPSCWLDVSYRLCLDNAGYLMVLSSYFGVYADAEAALCLCHFDYERDKRGYPEAHVQVHGESEALRAMRRRDGDGGLDRLHLPAGGRRYRVILEDVIEFLVAEKLVTARPGWDQVVAEERGEYERIQLRAAVRADQDTALDELHRLRMKN